MSKRVNVGQTSSDWLRKVLLSWFWGIEREMCKEYKEQCVRMREREREPTLCLGFHRVGLWLGFGHCLLVCAPDKKQEVNTDSFTPHISVIGRRHWRYIHTLTPWNHLQSQILV